MRVNNWSADHRSDRGGHDDRVHARRVSRKSVRTSRREADPSRRRAWSRPRMLEASSTRGRTFRRRFAVADV